MSTSLPKTFDVLVIGGGVIGLSTAWQLSKDGATVCVVDQGEMGREASWAGAGMVPPGPARQHWHSATALEQLAGLSSKLHSEWSELLHTDTGIENEYRRCGSIRLALSDEEKLALADQVQRWTTLGIECTKISRKILNDIEPPLVALDTQGAQAVLLPDEAQIDNRKHLLALAEACRGRGVTLMANSGIESFTSGERRISAAQSAGTEISADQYYITAGAWSGNLAEALGISVNMKPIRGQIVLLDGPPNLLKRNIYSGNNYLTPRRDGRILVGSTMEDVGFHKENTPQALEALLKFAHSLAPSLDNLSIEDSWSGLRPATSDGLPLMGRILGLENVWIATGHLRAGLQLSPATAVVMSSLIRGEQPEIDVSSLSVDR